MVRDEQNCARFKRTAAMTKQPTIPRGWRRLRVGSIVRVADKYWSCCFRRFCELHIIMGRWRVSHTQLIICRKGGKK